MMSGSIPGSWASLFVDSPNLERSLLNGPDEEGKDTEEVLFFLIMAAHIEPSVIPRLLKVESKFPVRPRGEETWNERSVWMASKDKLFGANC